MKLNELEYLTTRQMVNVEVILTLGNEKPKEVTKRDSKAGYVKEDCVAEDESGSSNFELDNVKGDWLLLAAEKEIIVEEFKMVDKMSSFLICQAKTCNKHMPTPAIGPRFSNVKHVEHLKR
ncbi:uncharacterized protein LOC114526656 [Dendronephthya gigantea]|uniref:uncharacterized protein LOC114526656 n=1 Tax=Dendronephthya gigantea TaxID=151771 RepID=UPI00106D4234|nr:uncharacterized protein LOC114526656 [Dendronephthya gigantea]